MSGNKNTAELEADDRKLGTKLSKGVCGIVRPIAAWDSCPPDHWADVHDIVSEACSKAGYFARLVSEMTGASVIQAEIVNNLYSDPVTICDVSGRNPNVMFELGMRIAFQKPVIIIVDDATDFSFDISPLRHIIYQRNREYKSIIKFQAQVVDALNNADKLTGYLSQFGDIHVTNIGDRTISIEDMAKNLAGMTNQLSAIDRKLASVVHANQNAERASNYPDQIPIWNPGEIGGTILARELISAAGRPSTLRTASKEAARAANRVAHQIAKGAASVASDAD